MLLKLQKVSNVFNFFRYYFVRIDHSNACSLTSQVSTSVKLVRYAKVMGKLFAVTSPQMGNCWPVLGMTRRYNPLFCSEQELISFLIYMFGEILIIEPFTSVLLALF
jgi:hypothetical protein